MFGYIQANQVELSDADKTTYKSYYCGLCRCLKEIAGARGQLLLNYDMTFLVILLSGLYELPSEPEKFLCALHMASKRTAIINDATRYGAAMNVILSYHNLMDDFEDTGNRSKWVLAKALKGPYRKVAEKYPRQAEAIEHFMEETKEAQQRGERNLDIVSGYTGEMLGSLFLWKEDVWKSDLLDMGYYMGKFIYLMDAYEDREKDQKNGNYNPLIRKREENPDAYEAFMGQTLTSLVAECARSFERLPIIEEAPILRNILYSGVWTKYEYLRLKSGQKAAEKAAAERKKEDAVLGREGF